MKERSENIIPPKVAFIPFAVLLLLLVFVIRYFGDMALEGASQVCVYAKLPRSFQIPTPVGNYAPDWAIAFNKGAVKHIFFIAETKGSLDSMELRGVESAKIECAKKLFNSISSGNLKYHEVTTFEDLRNIIQTLK